MKSGWIVVLSILLVSLFVAGNPPMVRADKLEFMDGTQIEGIIKKVEGGWVTVAIGLGTQVFNILEIRSMVFDTPHLPAGTSDLPLEHFLGDIEAQDLVGHMQEVEQSGADIHRLLNETEQEWADRKTITSKEVPEWEATKEQFRKALSRYRKSLNDFYFHVLGKVDEYNRLGEEANELYVGVKGIQMGSSLVSKDMRQLPLKKYVPSNWYDTIFYNGYHAGYSMGLQEAQPD